MKMSVQALQFGIYYLPGRDDTMIAGNFQKVFDLVYLFDEN